MTGLSYLEREAKAKPYQARVKMWQNITRKSMWVATGILAVIWVVAGEVSFVNPAGWETEKGRVVLEWMAWIIMVLGVTCFAVMSVGVLMDHINYKRIQVIWRKDEDGE